MEAEGSLPGSQEPATGHYPEPDKSSMPISHRLDCSVSSVWVRGHV
jgi:hypothetical protein